MPRSTFVGIRCLENHAKQRASLLVWSNSRCTRLRSQRTLPKKNPSPRAGAQDTWHLLRGRKNAQFVSDGFGLRIKGADGLRLRTRPSVLKTLHVDSTPNFPTSHLIGAPFFLAPLIAFLKSSIVVKVGTAALAFVKGSFLAKIFASAVAYLKSGTVFKIITTVGRVSLAVIASLRLQGRRILRWWHGSDYVEKARAERKASGNTKRTPHFRRTTLIFIAAPITLLAIAILASLERTPVWGRWRVIMMSTDEEALLVEEFLRPGSVPGAHLDTTSARDWLAILRAASEEEAGPPGTLMGMPVLDPRLDWRARWVMDVFAHLEDGVKHLNLTSEHAKEGCSVIDVNSTTRFAIPPVEYPLTVRPAALKHHGRSEDEHVEGPLVTRYACLVVESPVCNAFSLGFGPALQSESNKYEEAPGVVVVFTGLLDEILNGSERSSEVEKPPPKASSALFGIFQQAVAVSAQYPISTVVPTKHETDQLASTLAHELGHLLLSHSLESWASYSMYELLGALTTDLIRTLVYPFTAFFGPVFNDWFGELIRSNSALGLRVTSSCASRKAEIEADLIGLRILVGAGIDPRIALDEWGVGGVFDRAEHREAAAATMDAAADGAMGSERGGDESWLDRTGFTRSHPMNEERYRLISEELTRWEELGREVSAREGRAGAEKAMDNAARRALPIPEEARRAANTTS